MLKIEIEMATIIKLILIGNMAMWILNATAKKGDLKFLLLLNNLVLILNVAIITNLKK